MNEYLKFRAIPNDVTVTSQVGYFARFSIILLKMTIFPVNFSTVSMERGLGHILYFVSL